MSCKHFEEKFPDCTICNENKIINAVENKRKFSINNKAKKRICQITVDNCVLLNNTKKCDRLFLVCEDKIAYFVELKGQDLTKAIKQLKATIDKIDCDWKDWTVNARVVLSKMNTPAIRTSSFMKFENEIKELGGTFKYQSQIMNESVS